MDEMVRLLERLRPRIERLAGGRMDGEELYAEVELACVKKSKRYDWTHPKIDGRVMRMARNLRIWLLRRERVRRHDCLPSDDCQELASLCGAIEDEHSAVSIACREAVGRLPERYREVVEQHFFGGQRMTAIASAKGVPSATIRTICRRALRRLADDATIRDLWPIKGDGLRPRA
jgi:RNA polymerase sigma factor (sigma-70 family)